MIAIVKHAVRNLARKKFRTFLTVIGIAIGIASVVIITTVSEIGKQAITSELDSLGVGSLSVTALNTQSQVQLYPGDLDTIRQVDNVESAVPVMYEYTFTNLRGSLTDTMVWGIDSGADQIISIEILHGRLINSGDVLASSNVCLIDETLAASLYNRTNVVGKSIEILLGGTYCPYEIVGVVKSGGNILQSLMESYVPTFVYVPYSAMQRQSGRTSFNSVAVKIQNDKAIDSTSKSIIASLEQYNGAKDVYSVEDVARQKKQLDNLLQIVTIILTLIAGISLIVAGLGIMTIMMVSVNERTREIGIKKSIGATKRIIRTEFLIEAFAMSLIGSIAGAGIGMAVSFLGAALFSMDVLYNLRAIATAIVFSVATGMVFGVYPANKAANLKPVDALRFE